MELLLLLTALVASLTGASGDRAGAMRPVQGVAVVHAAEAVQAAAQPARAAVPQAALPALRPARAVAPLPAAAPLVSRHLRFERRLE